MGNTLEVAFLVRLRLFAIRLHCEFEIPSNEDLCNDDLAVPQ